MSDGIRDGLYDLRPAPGPVQQEWVTKLSWKKQTVLFGAVRAPDVVTTLNLKKVTTWIRSIVLRNADPMTGFMHGALLELPLFEQLDREWERLPLHSAHHILLAMQVIAVEHPDPEIGRDANKFYMDAVDAQHLNAETHAQYEARYADAPDRVETGTS